MQIAYDIETAASGMAKLYYAQKVYKPKANLKDPVKIEADLLEKRAKDESKAALRWWTSQVICVSVVFKGQPFVWSGVDEREVLKTFFDFMDPIEATLVGKGSRDFDLPMLVGRCLALDMGVPNCLRKHRHPLEDVDHIFSYRPLQNEQCGKLSDYAWGLGIDGKLSAGSEVAAMYEQGRWEELQNYCIQDSVIVDEMVRRYQKEYVG